MLTEEPRQTRLRILCVQEETHVMDNLRRLLPDVEFSTVGTAAAALDQARDSLFDLYIISRRLNDMEGVLLGRIIREFDPHTPILLCIDAGEEPAQGFVDGVVVQGAITNPTDAFVAPQVIRNALMQARQRSIDARLAECGAIQDEVMERLRDAANQLADARKGLFLAHSAVIMSQAYSAFAAAGGTRADFKRMWPAVYREIHAGWDSH